MDVGVDKSNWLVGNYKATFITYSAITQDFDKFLPTVNKIIRSFSANSYCANSKYYFCCSLCVIRYSLFACRIKMVIMLMFITPMFHKLLLGFFQF